MNLEKNRDEQVYFNGKNAYYNEEPEDSCPHPIGENGRVDWFSGYFDARTGENLKGCFERNNIEWP